MLQEADRADDLPFLDDSDLATFANSLPSAKVARVTNDLLGLYSLIAAPDTNEFAVLIRDNLIDLLVKHVCTTINGRKAGKRLRKFAETIQGIDIR